MTNFIGFQLEKAGRVDASGFFKHLIYIALLFIKINKSHISSYTLVL